MFDPFKTARPVRPTSLLVPLTRDDPMLKLTAPIGLLLLASCATASAAPKPAIDEPALSQMKNAIEGGAYPQTTSVLIMKDGALVYEQYFNGGSADALNNTRSATKTIVAMAVGAAIEDGRIASLDAAAFDYFGDLAPFANDAPLKREITIRDLLTMSSALDCDDNNDTPGNEENMYPLADWKRFALDLPVAEGWARDDEGLGPWRYCTAGSFLLGQIVERAVGERIDLYVERRLLSPLNIERTQWFASPSGEIQTGGGLELTARDLGKLGAMMADGGLYDGRRILPAEWVREMETPRRSAFSDMRYGYQMWTRPYASPCGPEHGWMMAGNGGNLILALPKRRTAIVITRTRYNTRGMHQETQELVERHLLPALGCPRG